jgi:hypothetical protein
MKLWSYLEIKKDILVFQKVTQSSESDTDFIQDITINSVLVAYLFVVKMRRQLKLREIWIKFIQNIKNMILTKK